MQKFQVFDAEPCGEIRGRLNAPFEVGARANQPFGNFAGTIEVHEKVVVDHPQKLQAVSAR